MVNSLKKLSLETLFCLCSVGCVIFNICLVLTCIVSNNVSSSDIMTAVMTYSVGFVFVALAHLKIVREQSDNHTLANVMMNSYGIFTMALMIFVLTNWALRYPG